MWIETVQPWHWMTIGIIILAFEITLGSEFLLGIGIGALMVAASSAVVPMHWAVQVVLFAIYSVVATIIYWKKFRASSQESTSPLLNQRVQQLMGKTYTLVQPVEDGRGKVQIADALWAVECKTDLPVGAKVKAVGSRRMTLLVEPVVTSESGHGVETSSASEGNHEVEPKPGE